MHFPPRYELYTYSLLLFSKKNALIHNLSLYYSQSALVSLSSGNGSNSLRYVSNFQFWVHTSNISYLVFFLIYKLHAKIWKWLKPTWSTFHWVPYAIYTWNNTTTCHLQATKGKKAKEKAKAVGNKKKKIISVPSDSLAMGTRSKTPQKQSPASHTRSKRKLPLPDLNR